MPLTLCPDCNGTVSTQAAACPHCGRPMRPEDLGPRRVQTADDSLLTRNRGCGDLVLYGGLGLVVLALLALRSCL